MSRQYVQVQFHPADKRTYTYHNDGQPVAKGDLVIVATPRGERKVEVTGLRATRPRFETKHIVRRHVEEGRLL